MLLIVLSMSDHWYTKSNIYFTGKREEEEDERDVEEASASFSLSSSSE